MDALGLPTSFGGAQVQQAAHQQQAPAGNRGARGGKFAQGRRGTAAGHADQRQNKVRRYHLPGGCRRSTDISRPLRCRDPVRIATATAATAPAHHEASAAADVEACLREAEERQEEQGQEEDVEPAGDTTPTRSLKTHGGISYRPTIAPAMRPTPRRRPRRTDSLQPNPSSRSPLSFAPPEPPPSCPETALPRPGGSHGSPKVPAPRFRQLVIARRRACSYSSAREEQTPRGVARVQAGLQDVASGGPLYQHFAGSVITSHSALGSPDGRMEGTCRGPEVYVPLASPHTQRRFRSLASSKASQMVRQQNAPVARPASYIYPTMPHDPMSPKRVCVSFRATSSTSA